MADTGHPGKGPTTNISQVGVIQEIGKKGTTGDEASSSEGGTLAEFQIGGHSEVQGLEQGQPMRLLVVMQLRGPVLARGHRKPPKGVSRDRQF